MTTTTSTDQTTSHQRFLAQIHHRRGECMIMKERAITGVEKTYWTKYEYYLGTVERSVCGSDGAELPFEVTKSSRRTLKHNLEGEMVKWMDEARTTTEKEVIQGCLAAVEEGLSMHSNITGIF